MLIKDKNKNANTHNGEHRPTISLHIPERSPCPKESILNDHKKLKRWLDKLPRANIGETSKQIFNTLVDFNRVEMNDITRIRIGEIFRTEVDYIVSNLDKHYRDSSFPLTRKGRKIAILARELYAELANSYKVVLDNLLNQSTKSLDKKLLIVALHRSISYLGKVCIITDLVYESSPKTVWNEIHQIYAYSAQNWLHQIEVKDSYDNEINNATIETLYKRTCLIAISSVNRLPQSQIYVLLKRIPEWANLINIRSDIPKEKKRSFFIMDQWSDNPPIHIARCRSFSPKKNRLLDASPLLAYLRKENAKLQEKNKQSIDREIIAHLTHTLHQSVDRVFARTQLHFEFSIVTGLNNIFHLISSASDDIENDDLHEGSTLSLMPDSNPNDSFIPIDSSSLTIDGVGDQFDNDSMFRESVFNSTVINADASPNWSSDISAEERVFHCQTINESAGGYCILWQGSNIPRIKIGEVIGIRSPSVPNQFSIAAIKWIQNSPTDGLQVGVRLISSTCSIAEVSSSTENALPALVLPEIASENRRTSLLVSTAQLAINSNVTLSDKTNSNSIRITHLLENTGLFKHYEYEINTNRPVPEKNLDQEENMNDNSDFSDVWSVL